MTELFATLRETITKLAAADLQHRRFGAARHRYEIIAPLGEAALAEIEHAIGAALPDDYRSYLATLAAGGVGPYYGLLRAETTPAYVIAAPPGVTEWQRALPIAHMGCGYAAILPLDGPARGQLWIDARAAAIVAPIQPSFTAFYIDWIDRLARGVWLDGWVPPGRCGLAAALTGYLGMCEQRLGIPTGTLAGDALRTAFADLGSGAIEVAAESPLFAPDDRVDPCATCARWLDGLADQGLRRDVVAAGVAPRPDRATVTPVV